MSLPELIELSADFITVGTIGPPGERTFFLQAAQDITLITLIIEKEHAAALSIAIRSMLVQLGKSESEDEFANTDPIHSVDLIHPVEPLFRVGRLGLGYDETQDMLIIMAEELVEEQEQGSIVRIWGNHTLMAAMAHRAAIVVASGRPDCPLCGEIIDPGEQHVCVKGNGRKRLYRTDKS